MVCNKRPHSCVYAKAVGSPTEVVSVLQKYLGTAWRHRINGIDFYDDPTNRCDGFDGAYLCIEFRVSSMEDGNLLADRLWQLPETVLTGTNCCCKTCTEENQPLTMLNREGRSIQMNVRLQLKALGL